MRRALYLGIDVNALTRGRILHSEFGLKGSVGVLDIDAFADYSGLRGQSLGRGSSYAPGGCSYTRDFTTAVDLLCKGHLLVELHALGHGRSEADFQLIHTLRRHNEVRSYLSEPPHTCHTQDTDGIWLTRTAKAALYALALVDLMSRAFPAAQSFRLADGVFPAMVQQPPPGAK